MTDLSPLLAPLRVGELRLPNRVVMAPMTRNRAGPGGVPGALAAEYYRQRASAGLIVTEGTQPCPEGQGYPRTPGLHTDAQAAGWRLVADAVHAAGGRAFLQLMHAGRVAHPLNNGGREPVAPSAVRIADGSRVHTDQEGQVDFVTPRALATREVAEIVEGYALAARRALAAGLDGVELHATSGYLPMQFLSSGTNRRTDRYGGSVANRARFALECLEAMAEAVGAGRVAIRVSPGFTFNDVHDDDPAETYAYLARAVSGMGLAYLHVQRIPDFSPDPRRIDGVALLRPLFDGPLVAAGNYTAGEAADAIRSGAADAVAFARAFVANPDLVERLRTGAALAESDQATWYAPGPRGCVDYPPLSDAENTA